MDDYLNIQTLNTLRYTFLKENHPYQSTLRIYFGCIIKTKSLSKLVRAEKNLKIRTSLRLSRGKRQIFKEAPGRRTKEVA